MATAPLPLPPVPPVPPVGGAAPAGPAMWPADVTPRPRSFTASWTKIFLLALGALVLPTALSALFNSVGWTGAIAVVMLIYGIAYLWALPPVLGASSLLDLARQLKKPAADASEEAKAKWRFTNRTFEVSVLIFLGGLMAPVVLLGLPLKGFGATALLILALVIPAIVWTLRYSKGEWVIRRFGWALIMLIVGTLLYWALSATLPGVTQGVAKLHSQATTWVAKQWTAYGFKTTTAAARGNAELASAQLLETLRTECLTAFEAKVKTALANKVVIPETEVTAEIAKCEAIGKPAPAPAVAQPTAEVAAPIVAAPAKSTKADVVYVCDEVVKEVSYAPGHQYGRVAIGTFKAGRYEVAVSGRRNTPFYDGTPPVFYQWCEMDPDGRIGICKDKQGQVTRDNQGEPWPAPKEALLPGEAYGKLVVHGLGYPLPIGARGQIESGNELNLALDVNNTQHPLYYAGTETLRVTIKQCHAA